MDEKQLELYGNRNEIDTEYERSVIEYRPRLKYEPNRPVTVEFEPEAVIKEPLNEVWENGQFIPSEKPTKQFLGFVKVSENVSNLIEFVEEEIKDMKIPLSTLDGSRLADSFPGLNQDILKEGLIGFEDYKKTFEDPDSPGNSLIQDIVHSYASDVEGNLELEFYEDIKGIQSNLEEGFFLYKETVLKSYLQGELPETAEKNEEFTKKIEEAVNNQKDWFEQVNKTYRNKESQYYESLRKEYGTPEFFKASKEYVDSKRPYDVAIREDKSNQELMELVDQVLLSADISTKQIKTGLVEGSDIDEEEVMKVIENQATTKEELAQILKMSQLSLKLQVNQQIEDKKQYRDVLTNINNLSRKKRAHDELMMAFELRNKMYLKTYDTLQNLESPSKSKGVESFLNQIAGGLSLVQDQYNAFLQDTYLMHVSEYEVRSGKIAKTLEKENARKGYALTVEHL